MKKSVAIVLARMESSRLPGKVLLPILGRPMLERQIERIERVTRIDEVVVATSGLPVDDSIARFCQEIDAPCHRGEDHDVLDRFYRAAVEFRADTVLRFDAGYPLVDPGLVARLIDEFDAGDLDYMGIATGARGDPETAAGRFPDGLDAEIMKVSALERTWREATDPRERELVTPYIRAHPGRFRVGELSGRADHGGERWTVDHESDYRLVTAIFERLYPENPEFDYRDVLALLERELDLRPVHREPDDSSEYRSETRE